MNATLPKVDRLNIGELAEIVQANCHISDARYAGNYSLCIFLLKMREYYRWEHDLPLSATLPKDDVGPWLTEREKHWDNFESLPYRQLPLLGDAVDPFDSEVINQALIPQGYVYSSGYGLFHKPLFFLARLREMREQDGLTILISDCEYARDLVAPPAMLQGNTIFIRQESLRRVLWEKIETWQLKKDFNTPFGRTLACYNVGEIPNNTEALLDEMCNDETGSVILHELGEAKAGKLLGPDWEEMIAELDQYKTELLVRAIRDFLADCLVTLPALLGENNTTSLHFYFANLDPLRKSVFPEIESAYQQWVTGDDPARLQKMVIHGQTHWHSIAQSVLDLYCNKNENFHQRVEELAHSPISL